MFKKLPFGGAPFRTHRKIPTESHRFLQIGRSHPSMHGRLNQQFQQTQLSNTINLIHLPFAFCEQLLSAINHHHHHHHHGGHSFKIYRRVSWEILEVPVLMGLAKPIKPAGRPTVAPPCTEWAGSPQPSIVSSGNGSKFGKKKLVFRGRVVGAVPLVPHFSEYPSQRRHDGVGPRSRSLLTHHGTQSLLKSKLPGPASVKA